MARRAAATWMRLSLVCAAMAGVALGTTIWLARSPPVRSFVWGGPSMGPNAPVENAIRVFEPFDPGAGTLGYYTGGRSGGTDETRPAPTRVMAESALGAVVVRIRAFDDMERPDAHEEASAVARVVSAVTTGVWPAASTPVEIDVHPGPLSYVSPVTGEGLAALLDLATREGLANPVGQILAESLLDEVFGDGPAMTLASPEGERLVSICRESLPDPARIATRLDEIARR